MNHYPAIYLLNDTADWWIREAKSFRRQERAATDPQEILRFKKLKEGAIANAKSYLQSRRALEALHSLDNIIAVLERIYIHKKLHSK